MPNEPSSDQSQGIRVDVWTWAVRLFKSRTLSAEACKKEHILINGNRCRPSRQVRVGDVLTVKRGPVTMTVEVKKLLAKRVGPKLVEQFMIDQTPPEVYEQAAEIARLNRQTTPQRERGMGRPTKRERRELDEIMIEAVEEKEAFEQFVKSFTRKR